MELFIAKIVSSFLEIILAAAIPFLYWIFTERKQSTFLNWLGFKKVSKHDFKRFFVPVLGMILLFSLASFFILLRLKGVSTATTVFRGGGYTVLPAILIYGIFNTALPEELFFRGFLLKRLMSKMAFPLANFIQSLCFALIHSFMFFKLLDIGSTIMITMFIFGIAYGMGYINEKKTQGSIVPSWLIHAAANIFSGVCTAFMLI
ncbi:CPBP family intramembrane glutamic endopeptidase [Streptococcus mutans]|uniref:CPBP family intramembrane glutamic endopeptidase n=1 Tax=Streptococcus mutans TaxID=1309 RepID=UPI0002B50376|nr:CPBP family intramembrane glutamic endopeptidase [Streptococcus mutans]EMB57543.1 CAAX amino terminal protease family protein, putative [Streptococcus mutans NLML8]